ncbi:MAG: methyltransferase [Actinomycetota bacterium]|nr:methyltransferase [Actinomycetota bacterium]
MEHPDSTDESGVTDADAPRAAAPAVAPGQYFDSSPEVASRRSTVRLDLPDRSFDLVTDRGVFSSSRIDPGTKLLLMELPELLDGPVVDVGCGYGPIACTVAARRPTLEVWAVDVNERARELCALNASAAGLEVSVVAPEGVPDELRFETIVSNPPIRIGKGALHGLLEHWLDRLTPTGSAWLVVQKHLGADSLASWLGARGHEVERIRSRQGYRILRVGSAQAGRIDPQA